MHRWIKWIVKAILQYTSESLDPQVSTFKRIISLVTDNLSVQLVLACGGPPCTSQELETNQLWLFCRLPPTGYLFKRYLAGFRLRLSATPGIASESRRQQQIGNQTGSQSKPGYCFCYRLLELQNSASNFRLLEQNDDWFPSFAAPVASDQLNYELLMANSY